MKVRVQGLVLLCLLAFDNVTAGAQVLTVEETVITDFRPVVARIEAMDVTAIPSRLQGVVSRLDVDEGQVVKSGTVIAVVSDETIPPQIAAIGLRIDGLSSEITQQEKDLARARTLLEEGFYPRARFEREETALAILKADHAAAVQDRRSLSARLAEGDIRAPVDGRVTDVLVVQGSVITAGQTVATIATLEGLVRLSVPERHLRSLEEGRTISLRLPARNSQALTATIVKLYPALENGAVIADATVGGGLDALVGERADVLVPIGERPAIVIPRDYVTTRFGIDFVQVRVGERFLEAPVVLAELVSSASTFEVLSGLKPGDEIKSREASRS